MEESVYTCKWHLLCLAAFFALTLSQCSGLQFYGQAIRGQSEVLRKARPIPEVLQDPETDDALARQLHLVQDLTRFAERELQLPARNQYQSYADLEREHLVWVLFACDEFSVDPLTWRYPLVGALSYRGYFDPEAAEAEAESLRLDGFDVFVGEVDAYSTLGWFEDPVLNTFVDDPDTELAELLFHELTHQKLYLAGDVAFNEALATAVGREGVRRWLLDHERPDLLKLYEKRLETQNAFFQLLLAARADLEQLYTREDLTDAERRQRKQTRLDRLRPEAETLNERLGGRLRLDKFFELPINNALLASVDSYDRWVPAFDALLAQLDGDLEAFFREVKAQRRRSPEQRQVWLESLMEGGR